jgi:hypothetical protein
MILGLFTLLIAILISAVSAYYSILGLVAIFAAAVIPVIIMGAALELGKITTAVWLHKNWNRCGLAYKSYLIPALIILMVLTSMGIFGFLSKAHVDQASNSTESVAQIQKLTTEIARQTSIVNRAETRLKQIETTGIGTDTNIQSQISEEQKRIDSVYSRIQPAIDEQQKIIDGQTKLYTDQIDRIDGQLAILQKYVDNKEIDKAQGLVGARVDGNWGPGTAASVRAWQAARATERAEAVSKLEQTNNNPTIKMARDEISRIRKSTEVQIADSNKVINRLRDQLGNTNTTDIEKALTEQQTILKESNGEIDRLTKEKYSVESEYRKLEAEVGPIKFIAEFIYGDNPDTNLLEKAVRWVIIMIVVVFDPLALVLILAGSKQIEWARFDLYKRKEEIPVESSKIDDEDNNLLQSQQGLIDQLEHQLTQVQSERDRLFKAHSHEMIRADELQNELDGVQENVDSESVVESQSEVIEDPLTPSENIIYHQNGYVTYEGKLMNLNALLELRPDLKSTSDSFNKINFGSKFAKYAKIGDIFIKTDLIPHTVFKFNGQKWIEIDKKLNRSYLHDVSYIQFLIDKLETGEYDADLLTDDEHEEIGRYLESK